MSDQLPIIFYIWPCIMIGMVVLGIVGGFMSRAARDDAEAAYQTSLLRLRRDPANASLRKRTIELGRVYTNASRNSKGIAYFDETALMNDISEACGGTTVVVNAAPPVAPPASPALSLEERLARLSQLKEREVISEEEYQAKRQQILDEL